MKPDIYRRYEEIISTYKQLIRAKVKKGADTKILSDRLAVLQSEFWQIKYKARENKRITKENVSEGRRGQGYDYGEFEDEKANE